MEARNGNRRVNLALGVASRLSRTSGRAIGACGGAFSPKVTLMRLVRQPSSGSHVKSLTGAERRVSSREQLVRLPLPADV